MGFDIFDSEYYKRIREKRSDLPRGFGVFDAPAKPTAGQIFPAFKGLEDAISTPRPAVTTTPQAGVAPTPSMKPTGPAVPSMPGQPSAAFESALNMGSPVPRPTEPKPLNIFGRALEQTKLQLETGKTSDARVAALPRTDVGDPRLGQYGLQMSVAQDEKMGRAFIEISGKPDPQHIPLMPGFWSAKTQTWRVYAPAGQDPNPQQVAQDLIGKIERHQAFSPAVQQIKEKADRFGVVGAGAATRTGSPMDGTAETFGEKAVDLAANIAGRALTPLPGMADTFYGAVGKAVSPFVAPVAGRAAEAVAPKIGKAVSFTSAHNVPQEVASRLAEAGIQQGVINATVFAAGRGMLEAIDMPIFEEEWDNIPDHLKSAAKGIAQDALAGFIVGAIFGVARQGITEYKYYQQTKDFKEITSTWVDEGTGRVLRTGVYHKFGAYDGKLNDIKVGDTFKLKDGTNVSVQRIDAKTGAVTVRTLTGGKQEYFSEAAYKDLVAKGTPHTPLSQHPKSSKRLVLLEEEKAIPWKELYKDYWFSKPLTPEYAKARISLAQAMAKNTQEERELAQLLNTYGLPPTSSVPTTSVARMMIQDVDPRTGQVLKARVVHIPEARGDLRGPGGKDLSTASTPWRDGVGVLPKDTALPPAPIRHTFQRTPLDPAAFPVKGQLVKPPVSGKQPDVSLWKPEYPAQGVHPIQGSPMVQVAPQQAVPAVQPMPQAATVTPAASVGAPTTPTAPPVEPVKPPMAASETQIGHTVQVGDQVSVKNRKGVFEVIDTEDPGFVKLQTPEGGVMPVGRANIIPPVVEPVTAPEPVQPKATEPVAPEPKTVIDTSAGETVAPKPKAHTALPWDDYSHGRPVDPADKAQMDDIVNKAMDEDTFFAKIVGVDSVNDPRFEDKLVDIVGGRSERPYDDGMEHLNSLWWDYVKSGKPAETWLAEREGVPAPKPQAESKKYVTDHKGEPVTLYRGRLTELPDEGPVFFYSPSRNVAEIYSDQLAGPDKRRSGYIETANIKMDNPMETDDISYPQNLQHGALPEAERNEIINQVKAQGHDGIIYRDAAGDAPVYIVFDKQQAKVLGREDFGVPAADKPKALADYGLQITKTTTNKGNPVWEVSGDTRTHSAALGKQGAGGKFYDDKKGKKVWSFYGDADPTQKILSALEGKGGVTGATTTKGDGTVPDATGEATRDIGGQPLGSVTGLNRGVSITKAAADRYEKHRLIVTRGGVIEGEGPALDPKIEKVLRPHQVDGVKLAIAAVDAYGGFILADGTGAGKTMEELAFANHYLQQGNSVLIVTPNRQIINKAFKGDAKLLGIEISEVKNGAIKPGTINITTYASLGHVLDQPRANRPQYVVFDESHSLKNYPDTKRALAGHQLGQSAKGVMFASATPFDKGEQIQYLEKTGIFTVKGFDEIMGGLGYKSRIRKIKPKGKDYEIEIKEWFPVFKMPELERRMEHFFDELADLGMITKREVSMENLKIEFAEVKLPAEALDEQEYIQSVFFERYGVETIEGLPALAKAHMLMTQRRFLEPYKIDKVMDIVKGELDAGRQVIIFATRVNETELKQKIYARGPGGERMLVDEIVLATSEGTLKTLTEQLQAAGHEVAKIYGSGKVDAEIDKFQSGKAKIAVVTPEKGGAGLSLDDVKGSAPRTMVVLTAPFSGVDNVQMNGRHNRLNTKSDTRTIYVMTDIPVDKWNQEIITNKMKTLKAVVSGDIARLDLETMERGDAKASQKPAAADVPGGMTKEDLGRIAPVLASNYDWYIQKGFNIPDRIETYYDNDLKDFSKTLEKMKQTGQRPPDATGTLEQNIAFYEKKIAEFQKVLDDLAAWRKEQGQAVTKEAPPTESFKEMTELEFIIYQSPQKNSGIGRLEIAKYLFGEGTPEYEAAKKAVEAVKEYARTGKAGSGPIDNKHSRLVRTLLEDLGLHVNRKGGTSSYGSPGDTTIEVAKGGFIGDDAWHEAAHNLFATKAGRKSWQKGVRGEWEKLQKSHLWHSYADPPRGETDGWDYGTRQTERYARLFETYIGKNAKLKEVSPTLYAKIESLLDEHIPLVALFREIKPIEKNDTYGDDAAKHLYKKVQEKVAQESPKSETPSAIKPDGTWAKEPWKEGNYGDYAENVPISLIKKYMEYDRQPGQTNTQKEWDELLESIRTEGIKEPVIFEYHAPSQMGYIGEGNHRIKMAEMLGAKEIPVRVLRKERRYSEDDKAPKLVPGGRKPLTVIDHGHETSEHMPSDMKPSDVFKEMGYKAPVSSTVVQGKNVTIKTERGTEATARYVIMDARDVTASHTTELTKNKDYPQEYQPRDRGRAASEMQVKKILANLEPQFLGESPKASDGRPLVDAAGNVVSGNGRLIALQRGYAEKHKSMDAYKAWLTDNAEKFGMPAEQIDKIKQPVLVGRIFVPRSYNNKTRRYEDKLDLAQFAKEANEAAVAAMSATEQAAADAKKLTGDLMSIFYPTEDGHIITAANRNFVRAFMDEVVGPTEQGRYMSAKGEISQEGISRIRNAVFAKAYGDTAAVEKLAESTDNNVKNITNAMLVAAPRLAAIKEGIAQGSYFDLDITPEVVEVMKQLSALRDSGMKVETFLKQQVMFEEADMSPLGRDLLEIIHANNRSSKKIAEILGLYARGVEVAGDPRQDAMFKTDPPTKAEVLQAAVRRFERGDYETTLFQDEGEARPGARTEASQQAPRKEIQARTAGDVEKILKGDVPEKITITADADIPRHLATDLMDVVAGWDIKEHPDGSVTFSWNPTIQEDRPVYEVGQPIKNAVKRTYDRLEVRDGEDEEKLIKWAEAALARMEALRTQAQKAPVEGKLQVGSGVRLVAQGILSEMINTGKVDIVGKQVNSYFDVAIISQAFRDNKLETFRVIYLSDKGEIVAHEAKTSRLPGIVVAFTKNADESYKDIAKRARRAGAKQVLFVHNHPSGDTKPSSPDLSMTLQAGASKHLRGHFAGDVKFMGHVIIDHDEYTIISPDGSIEKRKLPEAHRRDLGNIKEVVPHDVLYKKITGPDAVVSLAKSMDSSPDYVSLLYASNNGVVRAAQEMPVMLFRDIKEAGDFIRGQARKFGTTSVYAYYDSAEAIAAGRFLEHDKQWLISSGRNLIERGVLGDLVFTTEEFRYLDEDTFQPKISASARRAQSKARKDMVMGLKVPVAGPRGPRQVPTIRVREDLTPYDKESVGVDFFKAPDPRTLDEVEIHFVQQMPPEVKLRNKDFAVELFDAARRLGSSARYKDLRAVTHGKFTVDEDGDKVIQVQSIEDTATLAHEVGHSLDYAMNGQKFPSSIKKRFPEAVLTEKELREELKTVSQVMRPIPGGARLFNAYRNKHTELMADFIALYIMDPELTRDVAPDMTAIFEHHLAKNKKLSELMSDLHKARLDHELEEYVDVSGIKPVDKPTSLLTHGRTYLEQIAAMVPNVGRLNRFVNLEAYMLTQKWEKQLKPEELEDLGAAVEKIGNVRTGKAYDQIMKEMTPEKNTILKRYRYFKELSREDLNRFAESIKGDAEYIKYVEDYLLHFYMNDKKFKSYMSRWSKNVMSAKQRKLPTYQDAVEAGLTPYTQSIAWLYRKWVEINWKGAINQSFIAQLKDMHNAEGLPVIMKSGEAPPDWPIIHHAAVEKVYAQKTQDGKMVLWKGGAAIDPEAYKILRGILPTSEHDRRRGGFIEVAETFNAFAKWMQLSLSLFHYGNLMESSQAASATAWNPVRGIVRVGGKKETLGTGVKLPGTEIYITMPHLVGLKYLRSAEFRRDFSMAGLTAQPIPDVMVHRAEKALMALEVKTRGIPGANHIAKSILQGKKSFDRKLWNEFHAGLKMQIYHDLTIKALANAAKASHEPSLEEIRDIKAKVASIVNDAVGGQEWESHFWATPRAQQNLQLGFLAPDYSFSNLRIFGRAFTGATDPVIGPFTRRYWLWMALTLFGLGNIMNKAGSGHWMWENEPGRRFNIDITNLMRKVNEVVPWKDAEEEQQRYYLTIGKQAREVFRYFTDPPEIVGAKMSPAVRQVFEQMAGHSPGTAWPAPWQQGDYYGAPAMSFYESLPKRVANIFSEFIPFVVRGNNFALTFPMRRGMSTWQATRAWEDLIRAQVDPTFLDKMISIKNTETLVDDIIAAAEANGVNPVETFKQARSTVRTDYYGRMWRAIDQEKMSDADKYAKILLRLGVDERGIMSSGETRGMESKQIGQALLLYRQ